MTLSKNTFIVALLISAAIGFAVGFKLRPIADENRPQKIINIDEGKPNEIDFSLFWKAWDTLEEKYVDQSSLDYQKMVYGAISGMVDSLGDPYTVFFEPETNKKFQEEISGTFGGVGIEIGKRNEVITVIAPLKNTPASRAGIQAGDKILKIDGATTQGMAIEQAVSLIRGKKGSKVVLTVGGTKGATRDVTLVRETIKVPTVELTMIPVENKKIAYLQMFSFTQTVDAEFKKAAEQILKENPDGLVVDLRNNPGGLLDSAINIAGWFIDPNLVVVAEEFGDGRKNEFTSDGSAALKRISTVILTNKGSASASEILSGALRDHRGIKIVGEKTFGKGVVQQVENLGKGAALKVTVAKWLTPKSISISDKGIEPDIKVEIPEDQLESVEIGQPGKDPQLDRAIELLK